MTYLKQKPGSLEDVIAKQQSPYQESAYQDKFKKELDKAGRGIGSMTPKEKTIFFNKVEESYQDDDNYSSALEYVLKKYGYDHKSNNAFMRRAKIAVKASGRSGRVVGFNDVISQLKKEKESGWQSKIAKMEREVKEKDRQLSKADPANRTISRFNKKSYEQLNKEEWQPSNGKHADEQLMKDFISKGGKVEKVPENKRAYNGNRIKPHLSNKQNLDRQEAMTEEKELKEKDGANTSTRTGTASRNAKKKYRFGYRVAEKQPKGNDIEEGASELIKKAVEIAKKMANNYTGATNAIEALKKGLSKDPIVSAALLKANEELQEARWRVSGQMGYKGIGGTDGFEMVINATSEKDAIQKGEKELDKARKKRTIGPGGGGNLEDVDIEGAERTNDPLESPSSNMLHSHVPEGEKELKELAFFTKENVGHQLWGKAVSETENRGDSKLLPSKNFTKEEDDKDEKGASTSKVPVIKKDNKPGVKIAKIRLKRDKMDGAEGSGTKDPAAQEKQILTLTGQINVLKAKLENEKHKIMKPVANKETGQVPLTIGLASKLLRDKAEKEGEEDKKEDKKEVKKESVSPYKLKYETLRARLKEKAEKEKLAKKKDEPTKGRTMTGEPATKIDTKPQISYTM